MLGWVEDRWEIGDEKLYWENRGGLSDWDAFPGDGCCCGRAASAARVAAAHGNSSALSTAGTGWTASNGTTPAGRTGWIAATTAGRSGCGKDKPNSWRRLDSAQRISRLGSGHGKYTCD